LLDGLEAFVWAGVRGRAVAYNAHLQGQFRHSEHRFDAGAVSNFVLEYQVGFTMSLGRFTATASLSVRTAEFAGREHRRHVWGGYGLAYRPSARRAARASSAAR
jgi:hypothetical protein